MNFYQKSLTITSWSFSQKRFTLKHTDQNNKSSKFRAFLLSQNSELDKPEENPIAILLLKMFSF